MNIQNRHRTEGKIINLPFSPIYICIYFPIENILIFVNNLNNDSTTII